MMMMRRSPLLEARPVKQALETMTVSKWTLAWWSSRQTTAQSAHVEVRDGGLATETSWRESSGWFCQTQREGEKSGGAEEQRSREAEALRSRGAKASECTGADGTTGWNCESAGESQSRRLLWCTSVSEIFRFLEKSKKSISFSSPLSRFVFLHPENCTSLITFIPSHCYLNVFLCNDRMVSDRACLYGR